MTKKLTDIEKLEKLTDALVENILELSDDDTLSEAKEDYIDPIAENNRIRGIIDSAILKASKHKFNKAKEELKNYKKHTIKNNVIPLSLNEKKAIVDSFINKDPELRQKLTLAARNGENIQTENDIQSMFEDLIELGLIDQNGKNK